MTKLTLRNYPQDITTVLDNEFIDKYMAQANGEYVKVYLLLQRHMNRSTELLSVAQMADLLECTEKDVIRALKYWKKQGLLDYEEAAQSQPVKALAKDQVVPKQTRDCLIQKPEETKEQETASREDVQINHPSGQVVSQVIAEQEAEPVKSNNDILNYRSRKDQAVLKERLYVAEQYLEKTLTPKEIDTIAYFLEKLNLSEDLIDYLIESCVEAGHKSMRYIEKVAISWHEQGIKTVKQAKSCSQVYNTACYSVLNAYGIKNRAPVTAEINFIRKWTQEYAFSLDIILEACTRTMQTIHNPSFEYTDSILKKWFGKKVHSLKDVEALDAEYLKSKSRQANEKKEASLPAKKTTKTKFNNFDEREYNMSDLERRLVQQ